MSYQAADQSFSVAGFAMRRDDGLQRRAEALRQIERRNAAQQQRQQTLQMQADHNATTIASVNLGQWEVEKEKRVHAAFDRIIEKEWYDKYEANLKASERNHINAVREHFSMRRDKIKTPCPSANAGFAGMGSRVPPAATTAAAVAVRGSAAAAAVPTHGRKAANNTMHALEWAENVDALDRLGSEGNFVLQDRFLAMVGKRSDARRRAEADRVFAVKQREAEAASKVNTSLFPRSYQ